RARSLADPDAAAVASCAVVLDHGVADAARRPWQRERDPVEGERSTLRLVDPAAVLARAVVRERTPADGRIGERQDARLLDRHRAAVVPGGVVAREQPVDRELVE